LIVDERPSWLQLSGVVFVLAGIVVAQALPSRHAERARPGRFAGDRP
jgi:hypothetical protein